MVTTPKRTAATVARLWPGGTIACLATGPSLTPADVNAMRGRVDGVIAINNAFTLAPWADVLYACDAKWWRWHKEAKDFLGMKYAVSSSERLVTWTGPSNVQVLRNAGRHGLSLDPSALKTGFNSGYQAINLAVHLGAARILLLGYDMKGSHFFGKHPDGSRPLFPQCLKAFDTLLEPLNKIDVTVINCTRTTALKAFPQRPLEETMPPLRLERVS